MLNDNILNKRNEWTFAYKARHLLPYAERKLAVHQAEETSLRKKLATSIQDPASFNNDSLLQQLKRDVDRHAVLREQFQVYCHEFVRLPEQEYRLGLSDIVFFGFLEPAPPIGS
ncbi:MAG: hypothetical protein WKG01_15795 [Kofleriaceae bacterium]